MPLWIRAPAGLNWHRVVSVRKGQFTTACASIFRAYDFSYEEHPGGQVCRFCARRKAEWHK